MTDAPRPSPNRWKRFSDWDERPLRLDRFAVEDAENGFAAFKSPHDPKPSATRSGSIITTMDGKAAADFDMIDYFIARYHLDPEMVEEAMAIPAIDLARMLVDMSVPRATLVRLAHGLTPAKLAEVVAHLSSIEIAFAYSNAGPQDARQSGARHQRQGRSVADGG